MLTKKTTKDYKNQPVVFRLFYANKKDYKRLRKYTY